MADHAEKIANPASHSKARRQQIFAEEIELTAATSREIVEQAASTIIGDVAIETAHSALDSRDELTRNSKCLNGNSTNKML